MPHWRIKAAIQGTMSRLPNAQRWNRLFQQYVTKSLTLNDEYFLYKWSQCARHVANFSERGPNHRDEFVALELGTGWFPITPIGLALLGARQVYSIDMQDLLAREQVMETLHCYQRLIRAGSVSLSSPQGQEKLERALAASADKNAREVLASLGVTAVIADARSSGLPSESVDLICSNNTLEHIPGEILEGILVEFRRLYAPGGLMSHHIDLADHYVNFDANITVYNFLRFSERKWKFYNNSLQYQNRLRISDYRKIHEDSGWRIQREQSDRKLEDLRTVPIAPQFRHYSEDDLAVYNTWMESIPAD